MSILMVLEDTKGERLLDLCALHKKLYEGLEKVWDMYFFSKNVTSYY